MKLIQKAFLSVLSVVAVAFPYGATLAFPDKPVKIVVAYPPGGGVDFVGRTISQRLTEKWNQSVVVENKSGASGTIGAGFVAKSQPDGYTMLLASPAEVLVGPIAGQKINYDPERELIPVALVGETPLVIAVNPASGIKNLDDLIQQSKKKPGSLSYGTPGSGSSMHFAGEALKANAGIAVVHIPYRGAAPAVTDLLGNQIPIGIVGMPPVVAHEKSGKLKIVAVTSQKRSSAFPNIPAVSEFPNMKGYSFTNWMLLFVPANTPQTVIAKVGKDVADVVAENSIRDRLLSGGVEPMGLIGADLAKFMSDERSRYGTLVKERGIRASD